jgi:hypothetical protein
MEKIILDCVVPGRRGRGRPRRLLVQNVIDELGMTAADAGHLAQDREILTAAVIGADPNSKAQTCEHQYKKDTI